MFFYSGLHVSPSLIPSISPECPVIDKFTEIKFDNMSDVNIGWNYFLLWQENAVFISGNIGGGRGDKIKLLTTPETPDKKFTSGFAGKDAAILLSENGELWQYKIYKDVWKKIDNFIAKNDDAEREYVVKIAGYRSVIALTNLGRIYNVPNLVEMPKRIKFVDIACGFEHTIILADNGDIYSMGAGSRGQLGHGDLEDCDEPRLIEALAGLKVIEISAGGWHSAVITSGGDLYTWGWNTNGELGIINEKKVFAIPTVVDFTDETGETANIEIRSVQCGNIFTLCLADDGFLYGCGSNKYGQLGQLRENFQYSKKFAKLNVDFDTKKIHRIKCHEWGTVIEVK